MQTDEPDNAQPDGRGGYGDCIMPDEVVRRYQEIKAFDTTRPVFVNFGQAVANPIWFGRGSKCSEIPPKAYYVEAARGADIISFDIYPASEVRQKHIMGKLELVGHGVANLRSWSEAAQPVWAAIETTHIHNPSRRPLPSEIRSEVWMALAHGAAGILYFVHEWVPSFREDGAFRYHEVVEEIKRINDEVTTFAPILNTPTLAGRVHVEGPVQVATTVKHHGGSYYIIAVNMENRPAKVHLFLHGMSAVYLRNMNNGRLVKIENGAIAEDLSGYGVSIYKTEGVTAHPLAAR